MFEFQYVQNVESEEYVQAQSKKDFDIFEPITSEDLEMSRILDDMAGMHSIYIRRVSFTIHSIFLPRPASKESNLPKLKKLKK